MTYAHLVLLISPFFKFVALAVPLTSTLLNPRPLSVVVASATQGGSGVMEAIPAPGFRRMGESVEPRALIWSIS